MEHEILEVARVRATEAYTATAGKKAQITPAIISLIVDVALEVIQSCMKNSSSEQVLERSKNEFFSRLAIRRATRRVGETPNELIVSSVYNMTKNVKATEIEQLNAVLT